MPDGDCFNGNAEGVEPSLRHCKAGSWQVVSHGIVIGRYCANLYRLLGSTRTKCEAVGATPCTGGRMHALSRNPNFRGTVKSRLSTPRQRQRRMQARRVSHAVLRRARENSRCQSPSLLLHRSRTRSHSTPGQVVESHGRQFSSSRMRSSGSNANASKFPPPSEAASVPFPGKDLRVSRVGFGSPWMGAATDRGLDMSRCVLRRFLCGVPLAVSVEDERAVCNTGRQCEVWYLKCAAASCFLAAAAAVMP